MSTMVPATPIVVIQTIEQFIDRLRSFVRHRMDKLHKDIKKFLMDEQPYLSTLSLHDMDLICNAVNDTMDTDPIRKAWALASSQMPKEIYDSPITYKSYMTLDHTNKREINTKFINDEPVEIRPSRTSAPRFIKPSLMTPAQLSMWKPSKSPYIRTIDEQVEPVPQPFDYYKFSEARPDKKDHSRLLLRGKNKSGGEVVTAIDKEASVLITEAINAMGW